MEVRLTGGDVGSRVVIRWRRPLTESGLTESGLTDGVGEAVADVLGTLEAADDAGFTVRKASGERVVIPRDRALAAKTIPPTPPRRRT